MLTEIGFNVKRSAPLNRFPPIIHHRSEFLIEAREETRLVQNRIIISNSSGHFVTKTIRNLKRGRKFKMRNEAYLPAFAQFPQRSSK